MIPNSSNQFPDVRLRRLRQSATIRDMLAAPMPGPEKFVWPVFVVEGENIVHPIASLPGQSRYSIDRLLEAVAKVKQSGVNAVMLFGVVGDQHKDATGSYAMKEEGLVQRAVRALKQRFPDLLVMTDVCVCEYTSHGHCGVLSASGGVLNDPSLDLLTNMAVSHATAGADVVAPSAMMDGQIAAIRKALTQSGNIDTILMSYSTKFASAMYGPFREAADSSPGTGDRKGYQADYRNRSAALRESELDEAEGADILMVKPALFYLDILAKIRASSDLPLAAYNVSGEYAMLHATADRGWGDLKAMVRESIAALNRAGTDIFLSYWANQYNELLRD